MIIMSHYQLASAHTHCLIIFLKNIRSSERDAYSIDSSPIVNSQKTNNLDYFLSGNSTIFLRLNISVGSAHSTDQMGSVNRYFGLFLRDLISIKNTRAKARKGGIFSCLTAPRKSAQKALV